MKGNKNISVSTVTPVYSGEAYLRSLVEGLDSLRNKWADESAPMTLVESVFVDDGSVDKSAEVLAELSSEYPWVRVVSLSRNFGQHAATVAGICYTSSDWVVTMDEDLQHKPEMIEDLFRCQAINKADVVYAKPKSGVHGYSWRDRSSRLVKKILAKLTSTPQIKLFNSFRLIRGSIARAAASSSSSKTYLDISITWFTKSVAGAELDLHDERYVDQKLSGYGLLKLVKHARKLIVNSELDIASAGLAVGITSIVIALSVGLIAVIQKLFVPELVVSSGWTSIIAIVTFFFGITIALLCVALEYLAIVAHNILGRPAFFIVDRDSDTALSKWFVQ